MQSIAAFLTTIRYTYNVSHNLHVETYIAPIGAPCGTNRSATSSLDSCKDTLIGGYHDLFVIGVSSRVQYFATLYVMIKFFGHFESELGVLVWKKLHL